MRGRSGRGIDLLGEANRARAPDRECAIASFLQRYPEIELDVSTDNRIADVVDGGFDVVIRISRLTESSLVTRRLAEDRLVLCAAPSGAFAAKTDPIRCRTGGNFSTADGSLLREAAVAGLGIVVLLRFLVSPELSDGRLKVVLPRYRRGRIGLYAVLSTRRQLALRTRLLVEHLASHFVDPRW